MGIHPEDKKLVKQIDAGEKKAKVTDAPTNHVSRRDFIKYGAGAAVVVATASRLIPNLGLSSIEEKIASNQGGSFPGNISSDSTPTIVSVEGDQVRIFSGDNEVRVTDSSLASSITRRKFT